MSLESQPNNNRALEALRTELANPTIADLGEQVIKHIPSYGECKTFEHTSQYPEIVKEAIAMIVKEYNQVMGKLITGAKENETDYKYCLNPETGDATPLGLQVDMIPLPPQFLASCANGDFTLEEIRQAIKYSIFEIENSLGRTNLLEGVSPNFRQNMRQSLQALRDKHGKEIILLTPTQAKYNGILATELGHTSKEPITPEQVREILGFDGIVGPDNFDPEKLKNVLLYVRASLPIADLRKPGSVVEESLFANDDIREYVRARTITPNVDNPNGAEDAKLNDTKAYMTMENMGMGVKCNSYDDLYKDGAFTDQFLQYLANCEVNPEDVLAGNVEIRVKPLKDSYGCYGQLKGCITDSKFRKKLNKAINERGTYLAQVEMTTMTVQDSNTEVSYIGADRNFVFRKGDEKTTFTGFRNLIPLDSAEGKKGNAHGGSEMVLALTN